MRVVLSAEEMDLAKAEGQKRQDDAVAKGRKARWGEPGDDLAAHLTGAVGEYAVAKALRIEWDGNFGNLKAADVGPYQVRATKHPQGGLIVHPGEKGVFVLITGSDGAYDVRGWAMAQEAQQRKWWKAWTRPAFLLPQRELHPMESLPRVQ